MRVELETLEGSVEAMCRFYSVFAISAMMENEEVARGIMKKGARLKGIYDAIYAYARKHQQGGCFAGSTTDQQDKRLVTEYYLGHKVKSLFDEWFKEG